MSVVVDSKLCLVYSMLCMVQGCLGTGGDFQIEFFLEVDVGEIVSFEQFALTCLGGVYVNCTPANNRNLFFQCWILSGDADLAASGRKLLGLTIEDMFAQL